MIALTFNQININTEFKEQFAALYLKHQLKDDCAMAGYSQASILAADELLKIRYPYNFEIPPGVVHELAHELECDRVVLRNVVKFSAKAMYHFKEASPEFLQLLSIEVSDQIVGRLNQMTKQSQDWKEISQMRIDILESAQFYKDLIPLRSDSECMSGLLVNSNNDGV